MLCQDTFLSAVYLLWSYSTNAWHGYLPFACQKTKENVPFPWRETLLFLISMPFFESCKECIFSSSLVNFSLVSNQSGSCRQFGWWFSRFTGSFGNLQFKYFTEWSFLGWCHFELAQINFLPWKLYNKHSTFKKEPANGSLEHSKGNILKTN